MAFSRRQLRLLVTSGTVQRVGSLVARWVFPITALVLLLFSMVLRARLVETLGIHWDEYNFLAKAHLVARDELTNPLQTFHGHLFAWVTRLDAHEVDQIIAARWVMFAATVLMAGLLAYIGHLLIGGSAGVFAAFVFGSFWYIQHHGASFRYDGIIALIFLAVVALLLTKPQRFWPVVLAGVLGGVSLLVSIKAALYFPAFAVVALVPLCFHENRRRSLARVAAFVASGFATSATLLAWHRSTFPRVSTKAGAFAERAFDGMIDFGQPFPRLSALFQTFRWDTPMWTLILIGFGIVVGGAAYERGRTRGSFLCVLALATPLLSVYLYRNAWPYFYVSVLPGTCLLAGALWRLVEVRTRQRPLLAILAVLLMTVPVARTAWLWYDHNNEDENEVHRDIVAGVHEIFPEPVAYMDRCNMVASYPKTGWFMGSWSMEVYRSKGKDVVRDLLVAEQPKLLINNTPALDLNRRRPRGKHSLRKNDFATLKRNFIPHWGSLWVAGKKLEAKPGAGLKFKVLIPGDYTVEAKQRVELDGVEVGPGDVIELVQGEHRIRALGDEPARVTLRIGDHLVKPDRKPVRRSPLFRGFSSKKPKEKWLNLFSSDDEGAEQKSSMDEKG